jgi:hypothetical protein
MSPSWGKNVEAQNAIRQFQGLALVVLTVERIPQLFGHKLAGLFFKKSAPGRRRLPRLKIRGGKRTVEMIRKMRSLMVIYKHSPKGKEKKAGGLSEATEKGHEILSRIS